MTVTKFCGRCGKIMWDVNPCKRFCDECMHKKNLEKSRERYHRKKALQQGTVSAKQAEMPNRAAAVKPRIKSINQCVREADALDISYGQYVQRGYDKIRWEEILQKERFAA